MKRVLRTTLLGLGILAVGLGAVLRTTTAPTIFEAGVKDNVIPGRARAVVVFAGTGLDLPLPFTRRR